MPARLDLFEKLIVGWLALSVIASLVNQPATGGDIVLIVLVTLVLLSAVSLFAWLVSRRRKGWARWGLLAVFALLSYGVDVNIKDGYDSSIDFALDLIGEVIFGASLFMVFFNTPAGFFRAAEDVPDAVYPREYGAPEGSRGVFLLSYLLMFSTMGLVLYLLSGRSIFIVYSQVVIFFLVALGVVFLIKFRYSRLFVYEDRIESLDGLGSVRALRYDDIAGYRFVGDHRSGKWIEFVPSNPILRPIKQRLAFKADSIWSSWPDGFKDLDPERQKSDNYRLKGTFGRVVIFFCFLLLIASSLMAMVIVSIIVKNGISMHEGSQLLICIALAVKSLFIIVKRKPI